MTPRLLPGLFSAALVALLVSTGCKGGGPKVYRVSGTVRADGKPVPDLVVKFVPENGPESWGVTDEKGAYTLRHSDKTPGAVAGPNRVYVEYRPRDPSLESAGQDEGPALPEPIRRILDKYGSPETSPLRYDVTRDGQVIDITLD